MIKSYFENNNFKLEKIKNLFENSDIRNTQKNKNYLSLVKNLGVVPYDERGSSGNKTSDVPEKYKLVDINDLVINPMNVTIGSVGVSKYSGCLSGVYLVLKSKKKILPKFYHYVFSDKKFQNYLKTISNGIMEIRESLNKTEFFQLKIPNPTYEVQKIISSYLDKKIELIDSLISKTKKKIELLKQQKNSFINEIVTKGYDESAIELKETNIDWIQKIPNHWDLKKLKYISSIKFSSIDRHEYKDEKIVSICHYPDVYKNEFIYKDTNLPKGTCTDREYEKFSLKENDIILTKDSETPEDIGIPTFVSDRLSNTVCGYHLAIIRCLENKILPKYLYRYIESQTVKNYFYFSSNGITRYGLGKSSIENLLIPIPPKKEQEIISNKINLMSKKTFELKKYYLKRIQLLNEYKENIISNAISGKIKLV